MPSKDEEKKLMLIKERLEETEDNEKPIEKEVFGVRDVDVKTELDTFEIEQIAILSLLYDTTHLEVYETFPTKYMRLKKSHDRKSLKELIEITQNKAQQQQGTGMEFLNRLVGR